MLARGGSTRRRANDKNVGFTRVNARNINPPLVIDQSHIDEFREKLSAGAASFAREEMGK